MRWTAFLACGALLATPAMAQDRACRDLRTLLNADGDDFRALAWTMVPRAGVRPVVEGRRVRIPASPDCELGVEADRSARFGCRWESDASTEAGATYDQLIGQINACLTRPLSARSPYGGTTVRIVQRHGGTFATRGRQTEVELTLFEHAAVGQDSPGGPRPIRYVVELSVDLDPEQAETPEEVEEDESSR